MKLSRALIDVRPLRRYPDFGRLWFGQLVSGFGGQLTVYAIIFQVYQISGSTLAVGGVGLSFVIPSMCVAFLGGGIIDTFDRRVIVLVTSTGQAVVAVLLTVQAFAGLESLAALYVLVGIQGALGAVNAPARGTFMPRLIPKDQLHLGAALNGFAMQAGAIGGPAVAGLVVASAGVKACYLIHAVSFLAALYGVWRLPPMRPEGASGRKSLRFAFEGVRYTVRNRVVGQAFLADMAMTLLATPTALLPALNESQFGGRPEVLGLLMAATAVGGLIGSTFTGTISGVRRQGRALVLLCTVWGAAIALVGASSWLALAFAGLAVAGAVDSLAVVLRTAVLQASLPDGMRGRVGSLDYVVGVGGPQLGNFRGGALGAAVGPGAAVVVGGLSTVVACGILLVTAKRLTRFTRPTADAGAAAEPQEDPAVG